MEEYPNPALGHVLLRDLGPYIPVWLFGIVLALVLDTYQVGGTQLPTGRLATFLVIYSVLVGALVVAFFYRHYQSTPTRITITDEGVVGWVPRAPPGGGTGPTRVEFPFGRIHEVHVAGFFGPRVDAVQLPGPSEGRPGRGWDWLHLTPDNARRVADAWERWKGGQSTPATAVA